jgi:hypothetical protein
MRITRAFHTHPQKMTSCCLVHADEHIAVPASAEQKPPFNCLTPSHEIANKDHGINTARPTNTVHCPLRHMAGHSMHRHGVPANPP